MAYVTSILAISRRLVLIDAPHWSCVTIIVVWLVCRFLGSLLHQLIHIVYLLAISRSYLRYIPDFTIHLLFFHLLGLQLKSFHVSLFLLFLFDWVSLLIVKLESLLQALVADLVATPLSYVNGAGFEIYFGYVVDARYVGCSMLIVGVSVLGELASYHKWCFIFALRDSDTIEVYACHRRAELGVASPGTRVMIWLTDALQSHVRGVIWRASWLEVVELANIVPMGVPHLELVCGKLPPVVIISIIALDTTSVLRSAIEPYHNLIHFCHHGHVSIVEQVMKLLYATWSRSHRLVTVQEYRHLRVMRHLTTSWPKLATAALNHGQSRQKRGLHPHVVRIWIIIGRLSSAKNLWIHGIELDDAFALLMNIRGTRALFSEMFLIILRIKSAHHLLSILLLLLFLHL